MPVSSGPVDPDGLAAVHILVVDDLADNLLTMQALLARPGIVVLVAGSATQALALLQCHDVALALLDVQMPVVDGIELAERMRRDDRTASVPIIFMTGNGSVLSRTFQGYEAGAVDFLVKPLDPRVLQSKVRVFAELHQQRRELAQRNAQLERALRLNEEMAEALRSAHGKAVLESQTDALTGVANRRHILQLGEAMCHDRRREAWPLSLAVLDLDHFKAINDTGGHAFGDAVLRAFCAHVCARIRPSHRLGRLGGEEFLLLMPGTSLSDAEVVMERVRRTLQPHQGVAYTYSAGVAQFGLDEPLTTVVNRADDALYQAKRGGRDCSVTAPAPL